MIKFINFLLAVAVLVASVLGKGGLRSLPDRDEEVLTTLFYIITKILKKLHLIPLLIFIRKILRSL